MNYLGREIFLFAVNWGDAVSRSLKYDLKELLIGFGAETFQPTQTHTVNGWEFSTMLKTGQDILDYETFMDALIGRLNGFWLPCPLEAANFAAGVSTTEFDVTPEDLESSWDDRPDQHLLLKYPDGTLRAAQIQGVAAEGDYERVTLNEALPEIPPAGTVLKRLHYVRLAGDVERGRFLAENTMSASLSVIELPLEYAEVETGLRPILLYHFWMSTPGDYHWRYTSFAGAVVSGNKLYSPYGMNHRSLSIGTKPENQNLNIEAVYDANHPFALFFPIPFSRKVNVEVIEIFYGDLDTQKRLFTGFIRNVADDGDRLVATCDSWFNVLQRKGPRMLIQDLCNHLVYETGTCKTLRAGKETTAVIVSIDSAALPPTVTVDLLYEDLEGFANWITEDWFASGFLEVGFDLHFELRTIISSVKVDDPGRLTLELNAFLQHAEVGQYLQLIPGCNGTREDCINKHDNFDNYGGFKVPMRNLSMKAVNAVASQGDKK